MDQLSNNDYREPHKVQKRIVAPSSGCAVDNRLLWVNLRHSAMMPRKFALGIRADGIRTKGDMIR